MLLAKHAGDARPFRRQLSNVWRVELAAKDLLAVLVLLDDHDDVVINRQVRRPGDALGRECRSWQAREQSKHAYRFAHARSLPAVLPAPFHNAGGADARAQAACKPGPTLDTWYSGQEGDRY